MLKQIAEADSFKFTHAYIRKEKIYVYICIALSV